MNFQKELDIAINAAIKAGKKTLEFYNNNNYEIHTKSDESPVTAADLAANKIILEELKSNFNYPILSEENEDDLSRLDHDILWIIDPIDGTKGFINKTEYSILISLVQNKKPIIGVIYEPLKNKLYYASKNNGAFLIENEDFTNPIKLDISNKKENKNKNNDDNMSENEKSIENIKFLKGTTFEFAEIEEFINQNNITDILSVTSIGIKLAYLANNCGELYMNYIGKAAQWDYAAGHLIVEEAGGIITDLFGNELEYNSKETLLKNGCIAAANKKLHKTVLKQMQEILNKNN